ncbi:hypothetical protein HS088_TW13G00667 [Tripterygium wilfordii]|uniref:30S ribosomal protein S16 n=1 Tax=Tripterygium wilfordii TaxID=458696 RepID=A0A7J7CUK0_TRIWF|nr:30S ribosomal protein S16-2, chloroplastic/mitochondrial-like [Tripterygium wilfordii]XP_038719104.1 30S ribosomal protein S16-2, chloroplastic/mitochondrial-like [Tripterygium wilfordii]KAF5737777.1 hypothetical protein HS088_TW13G00667 [Tripterygium wilfordii]
MGVRIRFSRFGCKHRPFYRVIAADSKASREGKHLEVLGFYNPLAGQDVEKRMSLNLERLKYWLSVGAQTSDPVQRLLSRAGLLHPTPKVAMGRKGGPHDALPLHPVSEGALSINDSANADQSNGDEDGGNDRETISMDDLLCLSLPVKN